jgi:hypothetical protein
MRRSAIALVLIASFASFAGCASRAETVGTLGGAAAGNVISGGGTVGTAAGGVVGYEAGKQYDKRHP